MQRSVLRLEITKTTSRRHAIAFPEEIRKPSAFEVLFIWGITT
jgi:hypothetical protein